MRLATGAKADPSDGPAIVPALVAEPSRFPRPKGLVVLGLVIVFGGLLAWWGLRRGTEGASPAIAPMGSVISNTASTAPVPARTDAEPAPTSHSDTPIAPESHIKAIDVPNEPAPGSPTRPPANVFGAPRIVRTLSDRGSIKPPSGDAMRPKAPTGSSRPARSATFRALPASDESIDIQRENPYDP